MKMVKKKTVTPIEIKNWWRAQRRLVEGCICKLCWRDFLGGVYKTAVSSPHVDAEDRWLKATWVNSGRL